MDEWKQVREKIGGEPHGAVALELMAMELYRRDRMAGEACLKLNNTTNNVNPVINRLKELFGSDTNYARPYQIAAFLKGATPENTSYYKVPEMYSGNVNTATVDPTGMLLNPAKDIMTYVLRGGSYKGIKSALRSGFRGVSTSRMGNNAIGFRVIFYD